MTKVALTIAGSDSIGGAGIQADLKTFAMHCVHGASVVTCVTAQNTVGVTQVAEMSMPLITAQMEAVGSDLAVNAVKTGMLLNSAIITIIAQQLKQQNWQQLVVDPVMVSRTGVKLIDDLAIASLQELLIPQALIVTPNRYEAEILSGLTIDSVEQLKQAAIAIYQGSKTVVLAKGGSLLGNEQGVDVWYDGQEIKILFNKTITTKNTHGTGCTLSAAICANLALGQDLWQSVVNAKNYVTNALEHSLDIGAGNGPVGHFFPLIKSD
ncbi:bifunctional hydroxymethylpyrimidine kinase/phosphomethylpyrimidine kinase [Pleurocapsa sp. CCALA 161]|uniref:bifunctional hydroxymethylpyrimidine kinase/phosphomethylpyrimidine kinase n=1 Tax=Pleurocapsa sp. CCALA 161 TaxID=2107688 RepID=UPI000D05ABDA|nr:bifunctional hydroxymethylpyrimidine kinase/phosphomethylpyrimidine kinase [Pleurocapsa sp. CCALA 161]PSB12438.1 bifunctional hydroxymethylpyrimidine kinase/phosphomethylpyrimidine kinase [Pleurocapsa sp. CCALA 161]